MIKPKPKKLQRQPVNLIASAVNKPRKVDKAFADKIDKLYNRLQALPEKAKLEIAAILDCGYGDLLDTLLSRVDVKITKFQTKNDYVSPFQLHLSWQDMGIPAIYGYYRPSLYCIITSHTLIDGVILAYLQVSKQAGRFV